VVVEDASAGVEAGVRGGFALVIGVDRGDHGDALRAHGAQLVVHDMSDVTFAADDGVEPKTIVDVPVVWDRQQEIRERLKQKKLVVFLDYDGTLTPIVEDYNDATLSDAMRRMVAELARHYTVGIISGRDRKNLRNLVRLNSVFHAGSHGFDIAGPEGWRETLQQGTEFLPELDRAESELRKRLAAIIGARRRKTSRGSRRWWTRSSRTIHDCARATARRSSRCSPGLTGTRGTPCSGCWSVLVSTGRSFCRSTSAMT
jgi:alpha,alpha-trehalase